MTHLLGSERAIMDGGLRPVRECSGYIDRHGQRRWKAGCQWYGKHCRYESVLRRETYTTAEPPHQCSLCARQEEREQA